MTQTTTTTNETFLEAMARMTKDQHPGTLLAHMSAQTLASMAHDIASSENTSYSEGAKAWYSEIMWSGEYLYGAEFKALVANLS